MKTTQNIVWTLVIMLIAGCNPLAANQDPTPAISIELPPTESPTATPVPTETPLPGVAVLLASPEADPGLVDAMQTAISLSAQDAGLRYQMRPTLSPEDITAEDIRWVIAVNPASGIAELAATAPGVRFLAVGIEGIAAAPNLSVIGASNGQIDQQGFVAGYLAAMMTPDWRIGVISVADTEAGQLARRSFITGAKFYCGFCSPTYPPFHEYPLYVQLNSTAAGAEWQAAADLLLQKNVETIYIVPRAGDENLLRYLAQNGIMMIGNSPPPADLQGSWVATLGYSPLDAFHTFWPQFIAGSDGQVVSVPLSLSDVNQNLLSPGKQRMVEEMITQVEAGSILLQGQNIP